MMSAGEEEVNKEEKRWDAITLLASTSVWDTSTGNFSAVFEETRKWRNYRWRGVAGYFEAWAYVFRDKRVQNGDGHDDV